MNYDLKQICKHFQVHGSFVLVEPYGSGHINDTFMVTLSQSGQDVRYLFQRLNHGIFKNPPALMENIVRVTDHIRRKMEAAGMDDVSRRVLTIVPTLDEMSYHQDSEGSYWRCMLYIEGAVAYDVLGTPQQAYQAARAFGQFQRDLVDLPGPALTETIPDFHHSPNRLRTFMKILDEDPYNRACNANDDIDFVLKHASMCDVLIDLVEKGWIPERVTHNDTKINNVLFDRKTQEGLCVIDLDTVMGGLSLYDFGDMVRTATCKAAEDERDLSKIHMDLEFYEAIARGYAFEMNRFMTDTEKKHMGFSGKLITFEQAIRFLGDYLNGDAYYKIHRQGHNLDRARTQIKLVQSIQEQEDQMNEMTEDLWQTFD